MPLKIAIGCCNHLFGEGLKKLLLEECNLDTDSIITVSTNPREITKEENDLLITDFNRAGRSSHLSKQMIWKLFLPEMPEDNLKNPDFISKRRCHQTGT